MNAQIIRIEQLADDLCRPFNRAVIMCDCGNELLLWDDDNECETCHKCFNIFGQQLKTHQQRFNERPENDY